MDPFIYRNGQFWRQTGARVAVNLFQNGIKTSCVPFPSQMDTWIDSVIWAASCTLPPPLLNPLPPLSQQLLSSFRAKYVYWEIHWALGAFAPLFCCLKIGIFVRNQQKCSVTHRSALFFCNFIFLIPQYFLISCHTPCTIGLINRRNNERALFLMDNKCHSTVRPSG